MTSRTVTSTHFVFLFWDRFESIMSLKDLKKWVKIRWSLIHQSYTRILIKKAATQTFAIDVGSSTANRYVKRYFLVGCTVAFQVFFNQPIITSSFVLLLYFFFFFLFSFPDNYPFLGLGCVQFNSRWI